jgi:hypothetical protein
VASIAQALPRARRPAFGRCLIACISAWFTAVFGLNAVMLALRALSERWFGDVDTSSRLGFFSSSLYHPLGAYGLVTVALAIAVLLPVWLDLQCSARVSWWAALAVGALGAAGTQLRPGGGGALPLLLIAACTTALGTRPRRRLPARPRSLIAVGVGAWVLLGALLFVAAGRAVADAPLKVVFDGSGAGETMRLKQADTPPLRLIVRNRTASPLVVESVRFDVTGAGARQHLTAGRLPSGWFTLPAPLTARFTIAPRSDVPIGASWRSVCHSGAPGARPFTLTLLMHLADRDWKQARRITYICGG